MRKDLPDAQLQVIPDAGHLLNLEQPEIFNEAIVKYLVSLKIRG
jgi:pimeloyl-ACP methyl ester carboxylesterase